jgi:hypothetical protein
MNFFNCRELVPTVPDIFKTLKDDIVFMTWAVLVFILFLVANQIAGDLLTMPPLSAGEIVLAMIFGTASVYGRGVLRRIPMGFFKSLSFWKRQNLKLCCKAQPKSAFTLAMDDEDDDKKKKKKKKGGDDDDDEEAEDSPEEEEEEDSDDDDKRSKGKRGKSRGKDKVCECEIDR